MARMTWRELGASGDYPRWVRSLDGCSGVYAIKVGGVVRYVGESHTGRLRKTLTRHFQGWERRGGWVRTFLGSSDMDPGRTYDRGGARVAFLVCSPGEAVALQRAWIAELRPADNRLEVPDQEVPF